MSDCSDPRLPPAHCPPCFIKNMLLRALFSKSKNRQKSQTWLITISPTISKDNASDYRMRENRRIQKKINNLKPQDKKINKKKQKKHTKCININFKPCQKTTYQSLYFFIIWSTSEPITQKNWKQYSVALRHSTGHQVPKEQTTAAKHRSVKKLSLKRSVIHFAVFFPATWIHCVNMKV